MDLASAGSSWQTLMNSWHEMPPSIDFSVSNFCVLKLRGREEKMRKEIKTRIERQKERHET